MDNGLSWTSKMGESKYKWETNTLPEDGYLHSTAIPIIIICQKSTTVSIIIGWKNTI